MTASPAGAGVPDPVKPSGPGVPDGPTDAYVLSLAAKPGDRLFRVLENPDPLRPLLAVLGVLPAVLAAPRCRLDRVDPGWGATCLDAFGGQSVSESGPAAWLTGRLLAWSGTDAAVAYFALSWAGATLLVWAVWQLTAAAAGARPAAFAALLIATNPVTAAAAASAPPTVAGVAFSVVAAWLWVRAGRNGRAAAAAVGGAAAGVGILLGGVTAAVLPAAVAVADLLLKLRPTGGGEVRRRDRWPATLIRAGLYSMGFLIAGGPALFVEPTAAWQATGLDGRGVWLLVGLGAGGVAATFGGSLWVSPMVRRVVLGLAVTVVVCAATAGAFRPGVGPDVGTLSMLVAAAIAAAIALEGACRPAVSARAIAVLAALPMLALISRWAFSGSTSAALWRTSLVVLAAISLWGLWEVAAYRWSQEVRGRRLLIAAVVILALTGVRQSVREATPSAGAGTRRLVDVVAKRPARDVVILAEPADQPAAAFLFRAAAPGRTLFLLDPSEPQEADALNERLAATPAPLVAVVGGVPAARLEKLRPSGAAPPAPAGELRGGDGTLKEVQLLGPSVR